MSVLADLPSIAALSNAFEDGSVSPLEVVRASLDKAEATNPAYNAFIDIPRQRALRLAKAAEERALAGARLGDLDGIPIAVKDMIDVRGLTTTNGSGRSWYRRPKRSAPIVESLERLGAVVIGKTVPHELGVGIDNNNPHFGPTRNPWDRNRSPGGSSGGSAVAVAVGVVPGALGTDTGGSIRIPAAACGVFGLKPSFGALSTDGVTPIAWSLDHVGPLAARADDLDILFRSMAENGRSPAERLGKVRLQGLRIGVPTACFNERIAPDVAEACGQALKALERQGGILEEVDLPPITGAVEDAFTLAQVEASYAHRERIPGCLDELGEDARTFLRLGPQVAAVHYVDAVRRQVEFRRAVEACFAMVDILVVPTTPAVAQPIGTSQIAFGKETEPLFNCMIRYTCVFNVSGHPALAVPCPVGSNGLPVGIQIVGPMRSENRLLGIGVLYEQLALNDHHARLAAVRSAAGMVVSAKAD